MPPKKRGGHNKTHKKLEYITPDIDISQHLAKITKNQGNGCSVETIDGDVRHCSIKGKLLKRARFQKDDLVLIEPLGSNLDTCKWMIIHKYSKEHKERLQNEGFLDIIVQEESDNEEENDDFIFESDVKENEQIVEPNANFIDEI